MGMVYFHMRRTVPYRQMSGQPGPFGCDVWKLGLTSHRRVPAVVVTVRWTWTGAKSRKEIMLVQPVSPGHAAVCTLSDVPTGAACTMIGPRGAF